MGSAPQGRTLAPEEAPSRPQSLVAAQPPLKVSPLTTDLCASALHHAARDNTQLYLGLLPLELRATVDRFSSWRYSGRLRLVHRSAACKHFALDVGGEEVLVSSLPPSDGRFVWGARILRLAREVSDPYQHIYVDGETLEDVYGASSAFLRRKACRNMRTYLMPSQPDNGPVPLVLTTMGPFKQGTNAFGLIARDTWGNVLRRWPLGARLRDGWVRDERTFTNVRHLDRCYKIPDGLSVHGQWRAFSINESAMLAMPWANGLQVWNLSSGQMLFKTAEALRRFDIFVVHPHLRVLMCAPPIVASALCMHR